MVAEQQMIAGMPPGAEAGSWHLKHQTKSRQLTGNDWSLSNLKPASNDTFLSARSHLRILPKALLNLENNFSNFKARGDILI